MRIKKLTAAIAAMPFGIAAAVNVAASGSAPYYSNSSTFSNAAVNPYVSLLVLALVLHSRVFPSSRGTPLPRNQGAISRMHFVPNSLPPRRSGHRKSTRRRNLPTSKPSLASSYSTMSYPSDRISKDPFPDREFSLPPISTSTSWSGGSKGKSSHRKRTSNAQGGSLAQPGKVLSKEERRKRVASAAEPEPAKSFEEQRAEDLSFRTLWQTLRSWKVLKAVNASLEDNLAPEVAAAAGQSSQSGLPLSPARDLIISVIAFVIVFGVGWQALTYLFTATRASAQCTASTIYSTVTIPVTVSVPVTYTYTESIFVSPTACITTPADVAVAATKSDPTTTIIQTSTSTSTFFSTTTVTVFSATPSKSEIPTSSTQPFAFSVNPDSGSTSWVNGVSPSSGASLTTATTTIFVSPVDVSTPLHTSSTTSRTTRTHTTTITPPAETSTSTSSVGPDITITTHITRTSTITPLSTVTRLTLAGAGSSGWNLTTSRIITDDGTVTTVALEGALTTATISFFWASSGGHTYSTSAKTITTTLYHSVTRSVSATSAVPSNSTVPSSSAPNSTMANGENSSSFPTMSPGTDGISPASGTATAVSPSSPTLDITTTPLLGMTGPATGVTSSYLSNSSTPVTTSTNPGISPDSISESSSLTTSSASSTLQSIGSSTTNSSQDASPIISSNLTTSTSSLGATNSQTSEDSASASSASSASITESMASTSSTTATNSATGTDLPTSSSSTIANLTSATPSTQALSSIGSSLANGPAVPTSSSPSSATPSFQALSSIGSSLANSQAPSSSSSVSSTETVTDATTSSTDSATLTSSKTLASASASPTACGEHGDFTLNFDDLPAFSGDEDITQAPPIFSPYHHLTFSSGYVYAPQFKQPFAPHSGDQLAVFLASGNGTNDTTWHQNGMTANVPRTEPGEITDGPYDGLPAFWFNATGAWLGCDNSGPEPCIFNVTGWTWDPELGDEVATYNTQLELPPCPGLKGCELQHVNFPEIFRGLSGIFIQAFASNEPRMFFMDDLALSWYDNSCEAGMLRMTRPGGFGGPGRSGGGGGGSSRKRVVRRSLMR